MTKNLTIDEVKHIAKLLNLNLQESEIKKLAGELSEAASYVEVLQELDLDNTTETAQVTGLTNIFRQGEVKSSLSQSDALKNAKKTFDGYFVVPPTIRKK